ncbi:MAG: YaaR family protein [Defluviitaleaceae bacterium]|nr:YaaR family protein [Defluviitaleaceae bacterium]
MSIKINEVPQPAQLAQAAAIKEKFDTGEFSFTLKRIASDGLAERLEGLITDITAWGKKIAENRDIGGLKHYRGLVRDFINEVVTNSHEFSRENFLDRRGRHRVYGIVRLVNQELDALAQDLLNNEKSHIDILAKVDEIHGLLLDMII